MDETKNDNTEMKKTDVLKTGISGLDNLFAKGGIPRGNSVLVAGGTGTGKSTLCRQICYNLVSKGKKCMYVSFEESIERIEKSMVNFGWDAKKYMENGNLLVQKINPLDILRMVHHRSNKAFQVIGAFYLLQCWDYCGIELGPIDLH